MYLLESILTIYYLNEVNRGSKIMVDKRQMLEEAISNASKEMNNEIVDIFSQSRWNGPEEELINGNAKELHAVIKELNGKSFGRDRNGITVWVKIGTDYVLLDRHNPYRNTVITHIKETPDLVEKLNNSGGVNLENYLGFDCQVFKWGGQDLHLSTCEDA